MLDNYKMKKSCGALLPLLFLTTTLFLHETHAFTIQQNARVSTSTSTTSRSTISKTILQMVATPPSKYPTARGTTVDSRKIVSQGLAKTNLKALRLKHILFATKELATSSLHELRTAGLFFDEFAKQISACKESRDEGGEIGWVNVGGDDDVDANEHLDLILSKAARDEVIKMSSKVRRVFEGKEKI
jgi:hypothetical protein